MKTFRKMIFLGLALAFCQFWQAQPSLAVIVDDFNNNERTFLLWKTYVKGTVAMAREVNSRLELTIDYWASGATSGGIFQTGYETQFQLGKDNFEIIIDFNLLTWPTNNGVSVGINTPICSITRTSYNNGEYVIVSSSDHTFNQVFPVTAKTGRLRLQKIGNSMIGAFWTAGTGWHAFPAYTPANSIPPMKVYLVAGSADSIFANTLVKVALDNFIVNAGRLVWPPN